MVALTGSPVTAEIAAAKTKIKTKGFLNLNKKLKDDSYLLSAICCTILLKLMVVSAR